MISTASTPSPSVASPSQNDMTGSGSSDNTQNVHQDASTPSFASHLDYQRTQRAPQNPGKTRPSATAAQPCTTNANGQAENGSNTPASSSLAADSTASHSDATTNASAAQTSASTAAADASTPGNSKEKITGNKTTKQVTNQTPASADSVPAPLLTLTLAITNSIAPLQLSAQPESAATALPVANLTASINAPGDTIPGPPPLTAIDSAVQSLLPLPTGGPNPPAVSSDKPGSSQPLTIPNVSMDSRTASQIPVPGVANALSQSSPFIPAPASLSSKSRSAIPNTNPPSSGNGADLSGSASAQEATPAAAALPAADSSLPASLLAGMTAAIKPNSPSVPYKSDSSAMPVDSAWTTPLNVISNVVGASGTNTPNTMNPTDRGAASGANSALASTSTLSASNSSESNSLSSAQNSQDKQPDASTQHLQGIERLLTLGADKTALPAAMPAGGTSGQSSGSAQTNAQYSSLLAASTIPYKLAETRSLPPALATQTASAADNSLSTLGLAPTILPSTGPAVLAVASALASLQDDRGASSALHPVPSQTIPGEFSTTEILFAAVSARGQSSSTENSDMRESRSDMPEHAGEEGSTEHNSAANTSAAAALAGNTPLIDGASAETLASTTAPSGSSQIDRANIVAQVTQHLESMRLTESSGEMRVHLAPDHLGNVRITVASHSDGLVAHIAVESAQVQQVMDGAKEHLRATLEARGLHVDSVEISIMPSMSGNSNMAFTGQRNGQPSSDYDNTLPSYGQTSRLREEAIATLLPAQPGRATDRSAESRLDYRA